MGQDIDYIEKIKNPNKFSKFCSNIRFRKFKTNFKNQLQSINVRIRSRNKKNSFTKSETFKLSLKIKPKAKG